MRHGKMCEGPKPLLSENCRRVATPLPWVHSKDITAMDAHLPEKKQEQVVQTGRAILKNRAGRNHHCMHHTPCIKCDCTVVSQSVCPDNKHQILCATIHKCRFCLSWTKINRTNYSPIDRIQFFTLWYSTCFFQTSQSINMSSSCPWLNEVKPRRVSKTTTASTVCNNTGH